jgi:hypothetical protein
MIDGRDIWQVQLLAGGNGTTAIENDATSRAVYIGYAEPGSGKAIARWQIRKLTYDANVAVTDIQFASGSNEFKFIWDNRAGYVYS